MSPLERSVIPLMKEEYSFNFMNEPGITTTNFFVGSIEEALVYYKDRLLHVLKKNPWLAGRLEKVANDKSAVNISYQSQVDESLVDSILVVDKSLALSRSMSYEQICECVGRHKGPGGFVPNGYDLLKKGLPVAKFTLAPDASAAGGGFVFIPSLSHVVADGHTYFKILSMFAKDTEAVAMEVLRCVSFQQAVRGVVGAAQSDAMFSVPLIFNFMGKMLFGCGRCKISSFYVDSAKVDALKAGARERGSPAVPFVSTADVVTSHFAALTAARVLFYAINLRARMPSLLSEDHAGNYESAILLDPTTYASPQKIREVLLSAAAREGAAFMHMGSGSATTGAWPLPGNCEMISCRLGMVTSWVFDCYKGDLSFGACHHLLHLPVMQNAASAPFSVAVLFRACKGRLAVLYVSKTIFGDVLHAENSPLSREACV